MTIAWLALKVQQVISNISNAVCSAKPEKTMDGVVLWQESWKRSILFSYWQR